MASRSETVVIRHSSSTPKVVCISYILTVLTSLQECIWKNSLQQHAGWASKTVWTCHLNCMLSGWTTLSTSKNGDLLLGVCMSKGRWKVKRLLQGGDRMRNVHCSYFLTERQNLRQLCLPNLLLFPKSQLYDDFIIATFYIDFTSWRMQILPWRPKSG